MQTCIINKSKFCKNIKGFVWYFIMFSEYSVESGSFYQKV